MGNIREFYFEMSTKDIELRLLKKDLEGLTRSMVKKYGCNSHRMLCNSIFIRFMEIVVNDIIENSAAVHLPTTRRAKLYVCKNQFRSKETAYNVFDEPNEYRVTISFFKKSRQFDFYCYVSKRMQERIDYLAVNGKGYFDTHLKL